MRTITYVEALNEAIIEEMEKDDRVFVIGEDVVSGVFGVTKGLINKFGEKRVRNTPISESAIIGASVGASMTGLIPVAEMMYLDFITCAMDQVVNQAAKLSFMSGGQFKLPLVIRAQFGTGTREAAHHSQCLESWFVHTPGLKVVMPSSAYDAKGLLKTAIRSDSPVIFLEHRFLYSKKEEVPNGEWLVPFGEANIRKVGKDITVVATSYILHKVLEVADEISKEIDVEVIDPRTLVPLDIDTIINSVKKTKRILIVHEAVTRGGVGAEIIRQVVEKGFDYLDAPPKVLGGLEVPMPYSPILEDFCIPQKEDIIRIIKEMVK